MYTHIHMHMYMYMYVYMYMYMHVHMNMYMHMYIHDCVHPPPSTPPKPILASLLRSFHFLLLRLCDWHMLGTETWARNGIMLIHVDSNLVSNPFWETQCVKIGSDLGNLDVQCCVLIDLKMAQAVLDGQHFVWTPCKVDLPIVGECRIYIAKLAGTTAAGVDVEFSLKHVSSWLWASQDAESRLERFKKHRGSIENAFRMLFKSDPPELRQTAQTALAGLKALDPQQKGDTQISQKVRWSRAWTRWIEAVQEGLKIRLLTLGY